MLSLLCLFPCAPSLSSRGSSWPQLTPSTQDEYVCSADEEGNVALHRLNSNDLVALLTRTNLTARDVAFDPAGKRVAVVSDDLIASVIDVDDPLKIKILSGHKKALLAVTWSPDGTILVSLIGVLAGVALTVSDVLWRQTTSSSDGQIRVWDLTSNEANCIQVIDAVLPVLNAASPGCARAVWHPSGQYFVCANRNDGTLA